MVAGSSPTTSERTRVQRPAARTAWRARPPPFTREQCLRTRFRAPMSAPLARSRAPRACLSASVSPAAGATRSDEAPPERTTSTSVPASAIASAASRRAVAASPAPSGTGCAPVATSMPPGQAPAPPCGTITSPPADASLTTSAAARAMASAALPPPTTSTRPACSASTSPFRPWSRRVVTAPHGFFADMPQTGGLGGPTLFLALCAAINAAGRLLFAAGVRGMIASFVGQMVAAFVLAALLVLVAQNLFEGRGGYEPTFRVVAYAWAPLVVGWLPLVGSLALVYSAYLMLRGLERVQAQDTTRAALTLVISLAILWILARAGRPIGL